ncbi:MAG: DUF433 domain-containing protein [Sphingobacteriaceae bacterium]|nr:DUF433 domain-containing protein [Cytophagaceae bacterium]
MKNEQDLLARITVNANVLLGKPTIRGTRLSVEHLLKAFSRLSYENLKEDTLSWSQTTFLLVCFTPPSGLKRRKCIP